MTSTPPLNFGVIGNGSWATALIKILTENSSISINWWMRDENTVNYIKEFHHNPKYLSSVEIHPNVIRATTNIQEVIDNSEIILLAVPSAFVDNALKGAHLPVDKTYITAIKGIEPHSKMVIAKYLQQNFNIPLNNITLISGPCHAEEVALEKLSYLTISGLVPETTAKIANLFDCRFINISQTQDLIGAEYASVLKNIYAIGSGIAHGLGYGDNFQAVFVAAAIREMETFLHEIHVENRDVKEAAYLGDLLVTCYSQFSRNRSFGTMMGKGYSVKSAQLEMNMIAEGYYATELVYELATNNHINMPIVKAVYEVVYKQGDAKKIFNFLAEKQLY
jgi:glycerol-3-phosphate dehydrogenase (NAD(P)+)